MQTKQPLFIMRSSIIAKVFKKEMTEILRDKRMLFLMILLPVFAYPLLFTVIGQVGKTQSDKLSNEKVSLLVSPNAQDQPFIAQLEEIKGLDIHFLDFDRSMIDTMDQAIGLEVIAQSNNGIEATIFGDQSKDVIESRTKKITRILEAHQDTLLAQRLVQNGLPSDFATPVKIKKEDLSSAQQKIGKVIGGFIPFILIILIFAGCIYIAIDITAGEKERRTLQTLFSAPIDTREIVTGKFLAVFTVGLSSAIINLLSMFLGIYIQAMLMLQDNTDKMASAMEKANTMGVSIDLLGVGFILIFIVLLAVFFAALTLSVSLMANSYKEAQTYVSPMMMFVMLPAMLVQLPGMELSIETALVPILNVSLAFKAIFSGTYELSTIMVVVISCIGYAVLALWFASKVFGDENIITGQKMTFAKLFKK